MATFYDSEKRPYTLSINLGGVKRVRSVLGVDLMTPYEDNPLVGGRKPVDLVAIIDVIYLLARDDADKHGLTDEQWAAAMGGEQMDAAVAMFYQEWERFFRSLNRPDAAGVIQKTRELMQRAISEAIKRVEAIDLGKVVAGAFGNTSSESAASSAGTPTG